MPKKVADKKFQIQNNPAPLETTIKGSVLAVYTKTKRSDICFACVLDDMFSGVNTVRKAAWLTRIR